MATGAADVVTKVGHTEICLSIITFNRFFAHLKQKYSCAQSPNACVCVHNIISQFFRCFAFDVVVVGVALHITIAFSLFLYFLQLLDGDDDGNAKNEAKEERKKKKKET